MITSSSSCITNNCICAFILVPIVAITLWIGHQFDYTKLGILPLSNKTTDNVKIVELFSSSLEPKHSAGMATYPNTISKNKSIKAVLITQLSGELGNHLSKIAASVALSIWLQTETPYTFDIDIQLRHQTFHKETDQNQRKWTNVEHEIHQCFPNMKHWNFSHGNTEEISLKIEQLRVSNYVKFIDSFQNNAPNSIILAYLKNYLSGPESSIVRYNDTDEDSILFYCDFMVGLDGFVDRYINHYRQIFHLDSACCNDVRPSSNEVVFHLRNFVKDLPRKAAIKGYEELPSARIYDAVKHYIPSRSRNVSISIVTRPYDSEMDAYAHVIPYVDGLEKKGFDVQIVMNQTSIQDFCYLKSTKLEMIGLARSTFFLWAALLVDEYDGENNVTTKVQAYSIESTAKRNWAQQVNGTIHDYYNWTNPTLRNQFQFPIYILD